MSIKTRVEALEKHSGAASLEECLRFVDQFGLDFPDLAPTTQEARANMAQEVQQYGGGIGYMQHILDMVDGSTAHVTPAA